MSVQNGAYTRTQGFAPEKGGVVPRFFINDVEDPVASQREGRPIFVSREMVELRTPGNMWNIPVEYVNDSHRQKYPEVYKAFKDGNDVATNGTPLEQWPILKSAMVRELKALGLMTVEEVSEMNDHVIQRIMGGLRIRNLAKAYLDDAQAAAILSKTTADNEKKDAEIAELRRQLDEMRGLVDGMHRDLQHLRSTPSAVASHIPGMHDPIEAMKGAQTPMQIAQDAPRSALESLPDVKPRRQRQQAPAETGS